MTNKTTSAIDLVEQLPSKALFYRGEVPTPLTDEERDWLVEQLHSYPERVNEDRTCCISALTDMAMTEFCRLMAERTEAADTITRLQADVERAWNAGFTYGTGLYSSSPLPSAREDGWNRFRSSVEGE